MSDLINRQDAIDAINHICPIDTEYDCTLLDRIDVRCVLSELPSAVDAVEVVRCKDCVNWQTDWIPNMGGENGCHYCIMVDGSTEPLMYCGYAARKE